MTKKHDFQMRCIMDGGVLCLTKRGDESNFAFLLMPPERLEIETARDDEICVVMVSHVGRVEDTAARLRAFFEEWEAPEAKAERMKTTMDAPHSISKSYAGDMDIAAIHGAACMNLDNDPLGHDESLQLRLIGREVVKMFREGNRNYFKRLSKAAQDFNELQNWVGGHDTNTAKGRILKKFAELTKEKKDCLPSRAEIFDAIWREQEMDESQFRKDCKALGLLGLDASSVKGRK